ncbi:MAG TPA: Ig-like domain-containing protein [Terracidiphilus sp.]
MKRISAWMSLTAITCLILSGCGGSRKTSSNQNSNSTPTLLSISVTAANSATSIAAGQTLQLAATGKYSDGTSSNLTSQAAWKTSDSSLAATNASGLLTSFKQGSVTVSATQGGVTGSATIQVTQAALSSISVSGGASLSAGASEQLSANGKYSDASTQDVTSQATWQSSDATVATISASGLLTSLKSGTVTITASLNGMSGTATVVVTATVLKAIEVVVPSPSLASGATEQLSATGVYSDNSTQNLSSQVAWQSSDGTVATVSTSGFVTSLKAGTVVVTASLNSVSGTGSITVTAVALTAINVGIPSPSLAAGTTEQLSATGVYSDNSTQILSSQVAWQSSDATIASVAASGLLTSLKAGTITITASLNGVTGTGSVTVTQPVLKAINVGIPSPSLTAGATEQLSATGAYSDSSTQDLSSQVTWQSSDATIASVSSAGLVRGLKKGSVTITATLNSVSGTGSVTVSAAALSSISISPAVFTIASGQNKQLSAQAVYDDGSTADVTSQVAWSSATPTAATVDSNGLVTGVSAGSSVITASLDSKQSTAQAAVTAAQLQSITVTPASASIATGQTQAFTANGIFSDGSTTDITNSVTWSSSAENIAAINATGLATGVSAGSAKIVATSGSVLSSPVSLTVTPAVLTEIDISPDGQAIPVGGQYPLSLTGTYSDNTTQTINGATWSSSDSTLASVDNTGIVSGLANSNNSPVTITANFGGMSTTATVYITSAAPVSLQLTPASASIAKGTTVQFSANVVYTDGSIQPVTAGVVWQSSSASTAAVSLGGLATALAPGQATITATYDSLTATASLTVTEAALANIVVTPANTVVGINGNVQYTATGVFTDNTTEDLSTQVIWTSSNATAAFINATGIATGVNEGTTTVSATYGSVSGSATLSVTTAKLLSITITPSNPVVPPHSRVQLTAIGNFSDGSQIVLTGVSWHTNTGRYAIVMGNGVLRTKKATDKPVPVYASLNGITGQTSVTITSMSVQSLTITPSPATMAVGTNLPFMLTGTFSDGVTQVDLTASARWQTSNYADAVINRQGVATGVAVGTVTITATVSGLAPATASLTVSDAKIQSVTVNPANPTIALGSMQQFTATGLFSDGSTQDITSVAIWTSSNPMVSVVNQNGLASSASHGQTTITATYHAVPGSTLLSVN